MGILSPAFPVPCPLIPVPCPLSPVPCLLSPVPCPLFPVPCPLFPVPCPLFPVPCPLFSRSRFLAAGLGLGAGSLLLAVGFAGFGIGDFFFAGLVAGFALTWIGGFSGTFVGSLILAGATGAGVVRPLAAAFLTAARSVAALVAFAIAFFLILVLLEAAGRFLVVLTLAGTVLHRFVALLDGWVIRGGCALALVGLLTGA